MLRRGRLLTLVGVCLGGFALPFSALTASAATTSTGTDTLTLTAGALSVAAVSNGSVSAVLSSTSPVTSNLAIANWGDTTGSGAGWNGTMAVSLFNFTGSWSTTSGAHTLTVATSGAYTGTATQGFEVVTVSSDTAGTAVTASVTGTDPATLTAVAHGSGIAVGTHGVTIQFDSGVTYTNGDKFTIHFGNLPNTALVLGAGGTVTTVGTTSATVPTFTGSGTTVTGGASPTAVGTGVKFVTAALNAGMGLFQVPPTGTIAFDGNLDWAGAYVANVSYSITTGP